MKHPRLPIFTCRFTLTGLNLERFINTLQKDETPLLSVLRADRRTLICQCYTADLRSIQALTEEKGWRMQDVTYLGLSGMLYKLRTRPGLLIGAVLALLLAIGSMQFIWRVEINGAGSYQAELTAYLLEAGVKPGVLKASLNAAELEKKLTYRYPSIAWFHVYVYNITVVVDCTQGVEAPELPSGVPGDIVASRDGVIDSIHVFAGTAMVKAGDIVRQGQVLIRGQERSRDEQLVDVAARGVALARCWRTATVELPIYDISSEETGASTTMVQLCSPWLCYPAQVESPDYLAWNTYVEIKPIVGCFFPVYQKNYELREVSMEYEPRALDEVMAEGKIAALQKVKKELLGYEIVDKWVDYCMIENDTLAVSATAEWRMDIGAAAP
ncbi:MAG: sporulation protein YqfD [Eubacteriales bacterium]|nr:sporulation protein YqfD [Eubacteriales bacterium]